MNTDVLLHQEVPHPFKHRSLTALSSLPNKVPTQDLFTRATSFIKAGEGPADENALDVRGFLHPQILQSLTIQTLTVFLESILGKKYASPSADIISVLAGLEGVDSAFTNFVATLDWVIRDGRSLDIRQKAVRAALAAVAGAYQTGLVSYFINRDLFPSLMKVSAFLHLSEVY